MRRIMLISALCILGFTACNGTTEPKAENKQEQGQAGAGQDQNHDSCKDDSVCKDGNKCFEGQCVSEKIIAAETEKRTKFGCSAEGHLRGKQPPEGFEAWCEIGDKKDGPYKKWHQNGKLAEEAVYKDGELTAPASKFDEEGKPLAQ